MNIEWAIYILETLLLIYLLFRFIPKNKIREAQLAYLFMLVLTWLIGLLVAEYRLVEYPVRLFPNSDKANFIFEYFQFPSISALLAVHYPEKKSAFAKFRYLSFYCTMLTIYEVILEKYTNKLTYLHWTWYLTWIALYFFFYATVKYKQWFFK